MQNAMGIIDRHYKGYRDELVASGLVLVVATSGGFYILSQNRPIPDASIDESLPTNEQVLGVATEETQVVEMVDVSQSVSPTPTPAPTPTPEPVVVIAGATPVPAPQEAEYLVADDREFDNSQYILTLSNIRMYTKDNTMRAFRLEAVLANKSVTQGLTNRLSVNIVKDGKQIASGVIMSVSELKTVKPGEKITFSASLSLVSGTDVDTIMFNPTVNDVERSEYKIIN